jgi:hypothetical protein
LISFFDRYAGCLNSVASIGILIVIATAISRSSWARD